MDREFLAYLLIGLLLVGAATFLVFKLYHSHLRTYRRQRRREQVDYRRRMAERHE